MTKLIALDDGHGMQTPGKRTPMLPGSTTFMHENEFNRAVVGYLDTELKRCGFRTLHVAPGDSDVALSTRVKTANNAKADLYLSIHANANTGKWGTWGGIETYVYPKGESIRIGTACHKRLIGGTKLRDRGVKDGSHLYVIKETDMPAVLVEAAFMDNLEEAKLLMSAEYRKECAKEIAQGVCGAYGVKYVSDGLSASAPKPTEVIKEEEDDMLEKAIVINAFPDFPFAETLAARIKAPIYVRNALPSGKIAKVVYVVGGTKDGLQADSFVMLTGKDRFEVAAAVNEFLKK
jgi:N-acetylmuramoyl-L-alanine amidase